MVKAKLHSITMKIGSEIKEAQRTALKAIITKTKNSSRYDTSYIFKV